MVAIGSKDCHAETNCFAAVFEKYFEYQSHPELAEGKKKRAVIHYREDETMYVDVAADRVVVIFSTIFKDPDDNIIARVFMEVRGVVLLTKEKLLFSVGI